jgi:hypothetical protein
MNRIKVVVRLQFKLIKQSMLSLLTGEFLYVVKQRQQLKTKFIKKDSVKNISTRINKFFFEVVETK